MGMRGCREGQKETFVGDSLIVVTVSGVCTYASIKYQIVWLKYVQFLIYQLCFNKAVKIVFKC